MYNNSIKTRCVVAAVLLVLLHSVPAHGQQQPPKQCRPDRINELLQEIMNCERAKQDPTQPQPQPMPMGPGTGSEGLFPAIPRGGAQPPQYPRRYPGVPSRAGPNDFDFLNRGGPTFISEPSDNGGVGVLVSRPIPADVRPVEGEGIPSDSQFFIAGPRMRPNSFPSFGGSGFPLFSGRGGPPTKPQEDPNSLGDPQQGGDNSAGNFFQSFANNFGFGGGSPGLDFTPNFGGVPTSFGNPFEPSGGAGGNPFTFEISPAGPNSSPIDFDEIIRILKGLQGPKEEEADKDKKAGSGDTEPAAMNPDSESNTTEGIIDVDTTLAPTTEESMTDSTPSMPTEKP